MEAATDLGHPALAAVEDPLLDNLGSVILEDRFKQLAGRMAKQIMERRGFELMTPRLDGVAALKQQLAAGQSLVACLCQRDQGTP